MSDRQENLKFIFGSLPLDSVQRKAAEEGASRMKDEEIAKIATNLRAAFNDLPKALADVERLLTQRGPSQTQGPKT